MEDEFDLAQLEEMTDGDPELKKEMTQVFFECGDDCLVGLKESIGGGNLMWKEKAHALKGIALNFGATKVSKLSHFAEESYEFNREEKEKMFTEIQTAYKSAKDYFL